MAYVRTVKTASGATAVQIVHANRRGARDIEHIGSAHTPAEVEVLRAVARQRLHAGQDTLDFGDGRPEGQALPITSTQSKHLWDGLGWVYDRLGFDTATGGDEVFRQLVLARIVEPTSKEDSVRVLDEIGVNATSYRTIKRRLSTYAKDEWRQALSGAAAQRAALGPASLVLYDVSSPSASGGRGLGFGHFFGADGQMVATVVQEGLVRLR